MPKVEIVDLGDNPKAWKLSLKGNSVAYVRVSEHMQITQPTPAIVSNVT